MKKLETEHYKFNPNPKCEFFPCHKGVPEEEFNCLFCYCPLYLLRDKCGGNFSYAKGIKDCSGCIKPHDKNSYEFIMSKIGMVIEGGKLPAKDTGNNAGDNAGSKADSASDGDSKDRPKGSADSDKQ